MGEHGPVGLKHDVQVQAAAQSCITIRKRQHYQTYASIPGIPLYIRAYTSLYAQIDWLKPLKKLMLG